MYSCMSPDVCYKRRLFQCDYCQSNEEKLNQFRKKKQNASMTLGSSSLGTDRAGNVDGDAGSS